MWVRGAPLIGAVGAYGLALALDRDAVRRGARAGRTRRSTRRARPRSTCAGRSIACAPRVAPLAGRRARRRRVARGRRDRRRGRARSTTRSASHGLALLREIARAAPGPGRRDDPLQCRRARDLRLGHGDGAALPRARRGPAAARLGQRDAAAAAGRESHRVGAGAARRSAHAVRRRRERAADAARRRRRRPRRRRSRRGATATSATRSAPTTRRSPRATTACRSTSRCRRRRSTRRSPPATRSRSRRATPDEVLDGHRPRRATARPTTVAIAPAGHARGQLRVRRDAGAARHRARHRARRRARRARGAARRCFRSASHERDEPSATLRDAVIATARAMNARGINRGKSGNVSARLRRALRRLPDHADRAAVRRDDARTTSSR